MKDLQKSSAKLNRHLIDRCLEWLGVQGRSPNTLRPFGQHLRDFADFLGPRSILTVEHADVLAYLTGLYDRGLAKASVFSYVMALRAFQRFLCLCDLPNTGALGKVKPPKLSSRIGGFHPYEEIQRLIGATRTPRELALIEMAFATACRVSELAAMRIEQIDWRNRRLVVLGKGEQRARGLLRQSRRKRSA